MKMKLIGLMLLLILAMFTSGCSGNDKGKEKENIEVDREITIIGHTGTEVDDFYFKPSEITVKKGETVKLIMESANNVGHGIQVPALKINLTERDPEIFNAEKTGEFEGRCSVLCGAGHSVMSFKVIVEEE
jgi:cytochrome c oxidase subunit 2